MERLHIHLLHVSTLTSECISRVLRSLVRTASLFRYRIPATRFRGDYSCPILQAQTDNDDTLTLLDCLGEGAAAEEGGPLREVCAAGVVEFLRYAIKQTSKRQQVRK